MYSHQKEVEKLARKIIDTDDLTKHTPAILLNVSVNNVYPLIFIDTSILTLFILLKKSFRGMVWYWL